MFIKVVMADTKGTKTFLHYEGCNFFRQRFVLATLAGRPLKIKSIRVDDDNPGVKGNQSYLFV